MIIADLFNYTHRYKSIYLLTLKQSKTEWRLNQFSMPILWSLQNIEGKKGLSPAPPPRPLHLWQYTQTIMEECWVMYRSLLISCKVYVLITTSVYHNIYQWAFCFNVFLTSEHISWTRKSVFAFFRSSPDTVYKFKYICVPKKANIM